MKEIKDLRNSLFETIDALKNPDKPMEIERAKAIADVARVIVDSAKAEVDFMRVTGRKTGTGFIPVEENPLLARPAGAPPPKLKDEQTGKGYTGTPKLGHG